MPAKRMKALHLDIDAAATAALKVATPRNVAAVEEILRTSLKPFPLSATHPFTDIVEGPGLYYIDVRFPFKTKPEFTAFLHQWGCPRSKGIKKATSRSYPKRALKHLQNLQAREFIPFYLGRNKKIRSRVIQHLTGKKGSATYGLKLLSRPYLLKGCEFRASGIVFSRRDDAYFCVEFLEAAIRKSLHPIIGKQ